MHMAVIHRFRSKKQLLDADQALALREMIVGMGGLPDNAVGRICAAIDQNTASENGWSFVMLSPSQNAAVVKWLSHNSKRPQLAVQLWALCFTVMRNDTGEIMKTRVELADELDVHEDHVSEVMGELKAIRAISSRRERVPGLRGPGLVRYFMNPTVATHLPNEARKKAQAEALPLLAHLDDYR
jgi:hypothetical protein